MSVKVILIGDEKSGKTCLIQAMTSDACMTESYSATEDMIETEKNENGVRLCFQDISGAFKYKHKRQELCKQANVFLVCFDLSDKNALNDLLDHTHLLDITSNSSAEDRQLIFVGTKSDQKVIEESQLDYFMSLCNHNKEHHYIETSAKNRINIEELNKQIHQCAKIKNVIVSPMTNLFSPITRKPYHTTAAAVGIASGIGLIAAGITTMIVLSTPWVALLVVGIIALGLGAASAKKAYDSYQEEDEKTSLGRL